MKKEKAITLIVLVITIVVLIILAGITLNMLINNGIIDKAKLARNKYLNSTDEESKSLEEIYSQLLLADSDGTSLQNIDMTTLKSLIQQEVQRATEGATTVPTGNIISQMGTTAPTGYLICDGSEYEISEYQTLANYFKSQFGSEQHFGGSGTKFKVPDLRGEFLRGTGTNSHTNQGNGATVGTHQDGTIHTGVYANTAANDFGISRNVCNWTGFSSNLDSFHIDKFYPASQMNYAGGSNASTYNIENKFGNYSARPTNTSVLYCIKY